MICDTLTALRDAPVDSQQISLLRDTLQRLATPGQDW
jgi:hypothetical protein